MSGTVPGVAMHQLPSVVGQPKQYNQILANGPATAKMANGTHIEIKKETLDAAQGMIHA